jgi:hypothetical protein
MTLEQLRIFVAVAERQHVTRAAEALNLAQSAASAAIAALESQHGTQLFHRVGRGIELTEAGRLFLEEARAVRSTFKRTDCIGHFRCEHHKGDLQWAHLPPKTDQISALLWLWGAKWLSMGFVVDNHRLWPLCYDWH